MNEQAIQEQYQHIVSLLEQKRLKEAQIQLEAFLWKCKDWTLHSLMKALLVITTHSTRTKRIWLPATVCLPG